jgi:hypothetical protein
MHVLLVKTFWMLLLLLFLFLFLTLSDIAHQAVQNMCTVAWKISKRKDDWGNSRTEVFWIIKINWRSTKFWELYFNTGEQNLLNYYKYYRIKLVQGFQNDFIAFYNIAFLLSGNCWGQLSSFSAASVQLSKGRIF